MRQSSLSGSSQVPPASSGSRKRVNCSELPPVFPRRSTRTRSGGSRRSSASSSLASDAIYKEFASSVKGGGEFVHETSGAHVDRGVFLQALVPEGLRARVAQRHRLAPRGPLEPGSERDRSDHLALAHAVLDQGQLGPVRLGQAPQPVQQPRVHQGLRRPVQQPGAVLVRDHAADLRQRGLGAQGLEALDPRSAQVRQLGRRPGHEQAVAEPLEIQGQALEGRPVAVAR